MPRQELHLLSHLRVSVLEIQKKKHFYVVSGPCLEKSSVNFKNYLKSFINFPQCLWISWGSSSAKDCEFLQVVATTKVKAAVASSVDTFWLYDFLCWANPLHCRTQTEISLQSIFELSRCSIYYGTCLYGTTWPSAFVCVIFEASCSGKRFSILFICIVFFVSSRKA